MKRVPMKVKGVCKSAVWGGVTLSEQWGKGRAGEAVAESWELTVRKDENCVIVGGEYDGKLLAEWLRLAGPTAIGAAWHGEVFPLLIKFIDAREALSVQVHPDDAYAKVYERQRGGTGKTEMWYIVEAEPNASIVYGLKEGVTPEMFMDAAARGESEEYLRFVPVRAGESYFIPAGLVHAIGGGILIAEIQQNSDLTYRIYDYNRVSADGTPRELHLNQAKDVIRAIDDREIDAFRYAGAGTDDAECLANCPYFKVRRLTVSDQTKQESVGEGSFAFLLCVEGEGSLLHDGKEYSITRGEGYFLPAGMGDYQYRGTMKMICSEL